MRKITLTKKVLMVLLSPFIFLFACLDIFLDELEEKYNTEKIANIGLFTVFIIAVVFMGFMVFQEWNIITK